MNLRKFDSLQELIDSIDMGLDIEFYLHGTRYNISPGEDKYFICECPNGDAIYYDSGLEMINKHKIGAELLKNVWNDIGIYSM